MRSSTSRKPVRAVAVEIDRREEILCAATRLFAVHGFSDAVTQGLVDEIGIGKGTLYRNFPSKRELFLAAVDRAMVQLHEHVERAVTVVDDDLDRVRRGVRAYIEFFREHPEFVELLVQERAQFNDREQPTYLEHRERNKARWRAVYTRLIGAGRVRDVPTQWITNVMAAVLYGAMFLNDAGGRSGAFAIDAEEIIEILFRGLLTEAEKGISGD